MKISKLLLLGAMVAGFAAAASAQTEVYIAGSTAYRGAVTKAIQDLLSNSGSNTFTFAWDGGSSNKSVYGGPAAIFSGSYSGVGSVVIHTYWTGSVAGCVDVSSTNVLTGKFMADSVAMVTGTPAVGGSGAYTGGMNLTGSSYATVNVAPNVAMSDSFASSVARSVSGVSASLAKSINANLNQAGSQGETATGVLPFEWVAGAQSSGSAPFTNMTQEAASALIQSGFVSVSCLVTSTGSPLAGDTNDYAFLIGRNEDSGTRVCAQAEGQVGSAFGAYSFGRNMQQYYVLFTGTFSHDGTFATGTDSQGNYNGALAGANIETGGTQTLVEDIGLWPANSPLNTEPTLNWDITGHSGQISGGDVAGVLEGPNPLYLNITLVDSDIGAGTDSQPDNWDLPGNGNSTDRTNKAYLVGYLGLADASGIPASSNAVALSYNGVPYSPAALQNGSYGFWSFEHTYYNTHTIPAGAKTFTNAMVDLLYNKDCQTNSSGVTDPTVVPVASVGGLEFGNCQYTRSQEGAAIEPLF